jgi:ribosomal-protein-alanine N-acetyltransferase
MHCRPMLPSEEKVVEALARETGFSLDIAEEAKRDFSRLWVAILDDSAKEPDAFLHVWEAADELHVIAIGTRPNVRRMGLGRSLVETLIEHGRRVGSRLILLEVRRSNRAAVGLYRSFGFSIARLRRGYYSLPEEDGLEMMVTLGSDGQLQVLPDEVLGLEV